MIPPEPSPAPTLDASFPGFYPATPASISGEEQIDYVANPPLSAFAHSAQEGLEHAEEVLEGVAKSAYSAAAGLLGSIGGSLGLTREGSDQSGSETPRPASVANAEDDSKAHLIGESAPSQTDTADEQLPEFGDKAVEKEQEALKTSPAQALLAGAGGASVGDLLAGAAGAKKDENEVASPVREDNEVERVVGVESEPVPDLSNTSPARAPSFGTPLIEKTQSALALSPAQQLLRTDTSDSAVVKDETSLLAGAAGGAYAKHEVGEPSKRGIGELAEESRAAGAPIVISESRREKEEPKEGVHAVALEREISSPPSPQAEHNLHLASASPLPSSAPSTPLSAPTTTTSTSSTTSTATPSAARPAHISHEESTSSFAAAVLGAAEGVHTPTETGAREYSGFGGGPREIRASDTFEEEEPHRTATPTPESAAAVIDEPTRAKTPTPTTSAVESQSDPKEKEREREEQVVHNPDPANPAVLAAGAAATAGVGAYALSHGHDETAASAPQDFTPYSPPAVEQSPEAKLAASTPLPSTPGLVDPSSSLQEQAPHKSYAPAITGYGGIYPNSPETRNSAALASTETIPATINAQNVKPREVEQPNFEKEKKDEGDHHRREKELLAGGAVGGAGAAGLASVLGDHTSGEGSVPVPGAGATDSLPLRDALAAGPDTLDAPSPSAAEIFEPNHRDTAPPSHLAAGAVGGNATTVPFEAVDEVEHHEHGVVPATVNAQRAREEHEEQERRREEKGKGREMLEGAAVGVGAGALAGAVVEHREKETPSTPPFHSAPTSSTSDSVATTDTADQLTTRPDSLSEQRAFPTVPHMLRPLGYASTDEPILASHLAAPSSIPQPLDGRTLAAQSVATSPEQAGFQSVPRGGELTGAMQDFAHLSSPAERAAPTNEEGVRQLEEGSEGANGIGKRGVAAGVAGAGVGAGAAVGAHHLLARDGAANANGLPQQQPIGATTAPAVPLVGATPAAVASHQPQPYHQQQQPVQQLQQTPLSRFTEQTNLSASSASPSGAATPSSTRAIHGSPPQSGANSPSSSVFTGERTPPQQRAFSPARTASPPVAAQLQQQQQQPRAPISLVDAGVIERSPHMKIQTHVVDGHKRLHRKSLSGGVRPAPVQQQQQVPVAVVAAQQQGQYYHPQQQQPIIQQQQHFQQQQQHVGQQQQQHGRPGLETIRSQEEVQRRDRMLDGIVGVRDPTYAAVPSASSVQPPVPVPGPGRSSAPSSTPNSPRTSLSQTRDVPPIAGGGGGAPAGAAGVTRKLSKRRTSTSSEKKEGFFSRLVHGGNSSSGGHKRTPSNGSAASAGAASPRGSVEQTRI